MAYLIFILISFPAFAQTPTPIPNALDDAINLCDSFAFDKNNCLTTVNSKDFYQKSLVNLCGGLAGMDSDKITCLGMIGNKIANEKSVQSCNKRTWWDNTKACVSSALKDHVIAATPSPTPSPANPSAECNKEKAMDTLTKAIDQLKKMKYLPLYESLIDLKYQLKNCGF